MHATLRALRRRLAGRGERACSALVLLYHRLGDNQWDPWSLGVTPARFAEHMRFLAQRMRPGSLAELAHALRAGRIPPRTVVVTFDDGYAANLETVVESAHREPIPITSFLCSGALSDEREFWWDALARALLGPGARPRTLRLDGVIEVNEDLGDDAKPLSESDASRANWRAWEPPPGVRERLYLTLYHRLFALEDAARRSVLGALLAWADLPPTPRESHRVATPDETRSLAAATRIAIGAHTVTHPSLASLAPAEQEREIGESKRSLEEIIRRPVTAFAYPFGRRSDYDALTVDLVQAKGFDIACSNVVGVVSRHTSRFEIPRVQVQDWSADELARRIDRWLAAA